MVVLQNIAPAPVSNGSTSKMLTGWRDAFVQPKAQTSTPIRARTTAKLRTENAAGTLVTPQKEGNPTPHRDAFFF